MVGALGIEPRTDGLKGRCSAAELCPHFGRWWKSTVRQIVMISSVFFFSSTSIFSS
jgi:hypothetical protein